MQNTCRSHAGHMQNTCRSHAYLMQIMCRSHSDLVQSTADLTETMQIACRSHADHMQITCRSHIDHMQIICRSSMDPRQFIPLEAKVHLVLLWSIPNVSHQQSVTSKQFVFILFQDVQCEEECLGHPGQRVHGGRGRTVHQRAPTVPRARPLSQQVQPVTPLLLPGHHCLQGTWSSSV